MKVVFGAVVLGAGATALVLGASSCGRGGSAQARSSYRGIAVADPSAAPDFALRDQDGHTVRLSAQRGRFVIVAFLYTHCPDVCPLIAEHLNQALRELGPDAGEVRVLAVSVDPRGDTPQAVRHYVRLHRLLPQFRYLTGSRRQLAPVWSAYHVAASLNNLDLIDHTAYELLLDPKGVGQVIYHAHVHASDVAHDIRILAKQT